MRRKHTNVRSLKGHAPLAGTRGSSPGSDLCSRWVRTGTWPERICRSSFRPHWDGTGTVPRWGHTRCSASPEDRIGILGNGVQQRRKVRTADVPGRIPQEGVTKSEYGGNVRSSRPVRPCSGSPGSKRDQCHQSTINNGWKEGLWMHVWVPTCLFKHRSLHDIDIGKFFLNAISASLFILTRMKR